MSPGWLMETMSTPRDVFCLRQRQTLVSELREWRTKEWERGGEVLRICLRWRRILGLVVARLESVSALLAGVQGGQPGEPLVTI
jgi:hypothetical protein